MRFIRRFQWLFLVAVPLLLAGFQITEGWATEITRANSGFATEQWEPVSVFESGISIRDDKGEVRQRVAQRKVSQKKYIEAMKLARGNMLFERRKAVPVDGFHPAEQELISRYNKNSDFKKFGIQLTPDKIRQQANPEGDISYAVEEGGGYKCVVFFRYSNKSQPPSLDEPGSYEAITGYTCLPLNSKDLAVLEDQVLDLAGRVMFDGGKSTRANMFKAGLSRARQEAHGPDIIIPYSLNTQNPTVVLEGQLQDETGLKSLAWDGGTIPFDKEGKFKVQVPVPSGKSKVTLVAVNTAGIRSTVDVYVVRGKVEEEVSGKFRVLLMGIQKYDNPDLSLGSPVRDIRAMADILKNNYGYEVRVLENPKRAQILEAIEQEKQQLKESDSLVIYYAGHGVLDEEKGLGYWIPSDAKVDNSDGSWLPNRDVLIRLREIQSRRVLLIADACFSGALVGQKITQAPTLRSVRSRTSISSGGLTPVEDDDGSGHSPFAHYLLKALGDQKAGEVTDFNVFEQVRKLVEADNLAQKPQYGAMQSAGHVVGGGYFFR
ncbi:MAG: caspase family protein [Magnetococcales bacterium]|nr:caspase family protein [Magnetococcales bacterium]